MSIAQNDVWAARQAAAKLIRLGDTPVGSDDEPGDGPSQKRYRIDIAMSVRAYGFVEVEAPTLEAALEKIDAGYVIRSFHSHGHGDDDFGWDDAFDIALTGWGDEAGTHTALDRQLADHGARHEAVDEPPVPMS